MLKKQSRYRPTGLLVGVSLCVSSILVAPGPAAAAACQSGQAGCVLPVGSAPPTPAPVQTSTAPVYVDEDGGGGIGWLPILLGIAALAAVYFLFIKNDNNDGAISP
ncbi:MAG: hypothetical protein ACXW2T_00885 [Allosphingosinicella sp.]